MGNSSLLKNVLRIIKERTQLASIQHKRLDLDFNGDNVNYIYKNLK